VSAVLSEVSLKAVGSGVVLERRFDKSMDELSAELQRAAIKRECENLAETLITRLGLR
jgi:hypothetical protein